MNLITLIFLLSKRFVCVLYPICDTVISKGKFNSPEKMNFPSESVEVPVLLLITTLA
jgi:hypothetical protein